MRRVLEREAQILKVAVYRAREAWRLHNNSAYSNAMEAKNNTPISVFICDELTGYGGMRYCTFNFAKGPRSSKGMV
jgi:hypothetical protein